jgi:hypothetical protein
MRNPLRKAILRKRKMKKPKIVQTTIEPTLTDLFNLIQGLTTTVGELKTDFGNFKKETRGKFDDLTIYLH